MRKLLVFVIFIVSCSSEPKDALQLQGKIAMELTNSYNTLPSVHFPMTGESKPLKSTRQTQFSGLHWANTTNEFVGVQYFRNENGRTTRGNIIKLNNSIEVTDTIYLSKENEISDNAYLSVNDKFLLFNSRIDYYDPTNPLGQLDQPASFFIMDFKKKLIIKSFNNVAPYPSIEFHESPWVADENKFIFTITDSQFISDAKDNFGKPETPGIYLCDLQTDSLSLLVKGGQKGIANPVYETVAFVRENKIWIYDLKKRVEKLFYELDKDEDLINIHWTPDGKYIYLAYYEDQIFSFFDSDEKLIRISDGMEVKFNKKQHGFGTFTWTK